VDATLLQRGGRHPVVTWFHLIKRNSEISFVASTDGHRRNFEITANEPADEFSTLRARPPSWPGIVHTGEYMAHARGDLSGVPRERTRSPRPD